MKSFQVSGSDPTKQEKFLAYMAPAPVEVSIMFSTLVQFIKKCHYTLLCLYFVPIACQSDSDYGFV
jgi:hypothetical protein